MLGLMQLSNEPSGFMSRCPSLELSFFLVFVYIPVIMTPYANKFLLQTNMYARFRRRDLVSRDADLLDF